MAEQFAIHLDQLPDPSARVVVIDNREIGLVHLKGQVYAYSNWCLHQGGPVFEGTLLGKVEAVLREDRTVAGERFSEDEIHIVCPWHGYEYDVATGECAPDRRLKLRRYPVTVRDGAVYVDCDPRR
jgi:nitrite reductase (NADH) small subunit